MSSQQTRPLSPHIQIYRWQITSVLSILHRFTGIALCGGLIGFITWLYLLSLGVSNYSFWIESLNVPFTQFFFWCLMFSFNFHFLNGLRHLAWDIGWGFSMKDVRKSGHFVVIFSFMATILMFIVWR